MRVGQVSMTVWCGQSPDQLRGDTPDVVLLPERISEADLGRAGLLCPNAMIVGAPTFGNGDVRGMLKHRGETLIDYLKVGSDDRFNGAGALPPVLPVVELGDAMIGILVCRDFDDHRLAPLVLNELRASKAAFKLLCIPAAMHGHLFVFEPGRGFLSNPGVYIALSNGEPTHPQNRERSFIARPDGRLLIDTPERTAISAPLAAVRRQQG